MLQLREGTGGLRMGLEINRLWVGPLSENYTEAEPAVCRPVLKRAPRMCSKYGDLGSGVRTRADRRPIGERRSVPLSASQCE